MCCLVFVFVVQFRSLRPSMICLLLFGDCCFLDVVGYVVLCVTFMYIADKLLNNVRVPHRVIYTYVKILF